MLPCKSKTVFTALAVSETSCLFFHQRFLWTTVARKTARGNPRRWSPSKAGQATKVMSRALYEKPKSASGKSGANWGEGALRQGQRGFLQNRNQILNCKIPPDFRKQWGHEAALLRARLLRTGCADHYVPIFLSCRRGSGAGRQCGIRNPTSPRGPARGGYPTMYTRRAGDCVRNAERKADDEAIGG